MKNNFLKIVIFYTPILVLFIFVKPSLQHVKILHLYEGDTCRKGQGKELDDVCTDIKDCKSFPQSIESRKYLDICSFSGKEPIVCCPATIFDKTSTEPETNDRVLNSIADKKCREYTDLSKSYATEVSRSKIQQFNVILVMGGENAKTMEFPHMALLGYGESVEENIWGCGGSLINERWILTAAHCLKIGNTNTARWARLGDLNIATNADNARPKDYRIVQHVVHPGYKPPSRYNDIALFRLETDVDFSAYVHPICLNTNQTLSPVVQIATGWGKIETGGPTSDDLLKVELNVFPSQICNTSYFPNDKHHLEFGILSDSMICAGSVTGGKDTCGGDSGGPLQIRSFYYNKMYTQIGITSFGGFCGDNNTPGVYTRVSKYIPWIVNTVWATKM